MIIVVYGYVIYDYYYDAIEAFHVQPVNYHKNIIVQYVHKVLIHFIQQLNI